MKNFKLLSVLAVCLMAFAFTSCNDSTSGVNYPTTEEAYNMMAKFEGYHQCGILFPSDEKNNIADKDSIETTVRIAARDSSYTISNFPTKCLAKYIKDEKISKAVAELPNQTLQGKLLAYPGSTVASPMFGSATNNIKFQIDGKNYTLAFYAGYNSFALAGAAVDNAKKNCFVLYITPGAIYEGTSVVSDALKYGTGIYGSTPYVVTLKYFL